MGLRWRIGVLLAILACGLAACGDGGAADDEPDGRQALPRSHCPSPGSPCA